MSEKKNAVFTIIIICAMILVFTITDFFNEERLYSDTENRILAAKPEFSREELFYGDYTTRYEDYITDQFVSRDKWIEVKTRADMALQKKEINGVYLGEDEYLIEKHNPGDYSDELVEEKLELLKQLAERWDAKVMLVPTADNVITDKLPPYAVYYDQKAFLERARSVVGEEHYVDVYSALQAHAD